MTDEATLQRQALAAQSAFLTARYPDGPDVAGPDDEDLAA